eukprot:3616626-Pyramimonas_sp.AAC.1
MKLFTRTRVLQILRGTASRCLLKRAHACASLYELISASCSLVHSYNLPYIPPDARRISRSVCRAAECRFCDPLCSPSGLRPTWTRAAVRGAGRLAVMLRASRSVGAEAPKPPQEA